MKIDSLSWETVKISYAEPVQTVRNKITTEDNLQNARIVFHAKTDEAPGTLEVRAGDSAILLSRPEVLELSPWSAKFTAMWWSARLDATGYDRLVKTTIECVF